MADVIKVLHLSTHNEECGIAKFQENIVDGMGNSKQIRNVFFSVSPNILKTLQGAEFDKALRALLDQLKDFDILHIQHEYSFYAVGQLQRIVNGAKASHKKVLFTLHTPPHAHRQGVERRARIGHRPRSVLHALRVARADKRFVADFIRPLLTADLLIATSHASVESFSAYGVPTRLMQVIELPVPRVDRNQNSTEITEQLGKKETDIMLSTVGFLSETKGIIAALKALALLPPHYKLAIIGGSHPSGQNDAFYDHVTDILLVQGLQNRVYITGYVSDDSKRDALIRETDICLYPYDKQYYNFVSSAALTNAVANDVPIIAYTTKTFLEANAAVPFINFTKSANYYELARSIRTIDVAKSKELTRQYAALFSVENQASRFAEAYHALTR
jgi:glycosyltransferase involved in cell wall biosynthesis